MLVVWTILKPSTVYYIVNFLIKCCWKDSLQYFWGCWCSSISIRQLTSDGKTKLVTDLIRVMVLDRELWPVQYYIASKYCEDIFLEFKKKLGCWIKLIYLGVLGYRDDNFLLSILLLLSLFKKWYGRVKSLPKVTICSLTQIPTLLSVKLN